ncbi:SHOCT domain-containing protein [Caballeronia sp. SEWSISQ10-4 2]|uniref:SHOCT domain-containing protein n=1 Tax=Caballeronia sp. SEWSISQ10-4 2 TaxID=2937438 RepID=UPI00264D41E2|nr:SHOCT domain-containing protein [Caballeronia sp. SEWSISQ10-4 2]MDN7182949.1 SHOCT domain-containing protein [Caballeronia sp. SEWSISQ10-4 2]
MKNKTLLLTFLLAGCASVSDIDTSKIDAACAQSCTANYSECLGKFTLFPLMAQHQCTDAMHLCANACPSRVADSPNAGGTTSRKLADLSDLYKRGLISKEEYDSKRADILKAM